MLKFKSWPRKDKWLFVLTLGGILCILAFPVGNAGKSVGVFNSERATKGQIENSVEGELENREASVAKVTGSYEEQLQERVKEVLKNVDGVGEVDVLIVLKSSAEKIIHTDADISDTLTDESDGNGLLRKSQGKERSDTTVLAGGSGENQPIIEKELYPELSGIVISATGGGNPKVQAEISVAMEALFGLPAHKIKVLKRVE